MAVLSTDATVNQGVIDVSVECRGPRTCDGSFALIKPGTLSQMAASNFSVPASQTATIEVAMTALGEQLAASPGGSQADVWVFLHGSGDENCGSAGCQTPPQILVHD